MFFFVFAFFGLDDPPMPEYSLIKKGEFERWGN